MRDVGQIGMKEITGIAECGRQTDAMNSS